MNSQPPTMLSSPVYTETYREFSWLSFSCGPPLRHRAPSSCIHRNPEKDQAQNQRMHLHLDRQHGKCLPKQENKHDLEHMQLMLFCGRDF